MPNPENNKRVKTVCATCQLVLVVVCFVRIMPSLIELSVPIHGLLQVRRFDLCFAGRQADADCRIVEASAPGI